MNTPKAIETLEAHVKWCDPVKEVDTYNALKLGIEALKWREKQKDYGYLDFDDLLPGETE